MNRAGWFEMRGTADERHRIFIPKPLPVEPTITWTDPLHDLEEKANRAIGRLDGLSAVLPDARPFLYGYIREEAILSSPD